MARIEDTQHKSGDQGDLVLAVRKDSGGTLAGTDGDYVPLQTDADGYLRVTVAASGSSATVQVVGNVAHDAADSGNPVKIGAVARDPDIMPADVAAADRVNLQADLKGRLIVYLATTLDSTNDSVRVVGAAAHDATLSGNPVLVAAASSAAAPTDVSADGAAVRFWALRNGSLVVNVAAAGTLVAVAAGTAANALRTTLASDDPAVVALQIMDDWDETNRAAVNLIAGQVGVQGASGVVTALTQRVVLATDVALPAGTANIGDVDVLTTQTGTVQRPTITTTASPDYTSGDVIGGIITLTGVMSASGRSAVLRSVTMKDDSNQGPALSLLFFRATPAAGTYTDNAQLVWGAGDLANLVGVVRINTTDWYTPAASVNKALVSIGDIGQIMGAATSDLFLLIIADETINLASTSDLSIELGFEQR